MDKKSIVPEMGCAKYDESDLVITDELDSVDYMTQFVVPCFANLDSHDYALDVGCGNGRMSHILARHFNRVIAIDKYREPNSLLMHSNVTFLQQSFTDFGCSFDVFDVIVFWAVFYCLGEDYDKLFTKAWNMLRPHGMMVFFENTEHWVARSNARKYYYPFIEMVQERQDIQESTFRLLNPKYSLCLITKKGH